MAQTASDETLSFIFGESTKSDDGLCDPFEESCLLEKEVTTVSNPLRRSSQRTMPSAQPDIQKVIDYDQEPATYTFRWDVEVPLADRAKCGPKFMKQWKRVLQAQKLTPLVSMKLPLRDARFQLCISGIGEAELVVAHEREIAEELSRLRRDASPIAGDPAGIHPTGWQGVRLWMTFARHDVETALAKKPRV